MYIHIYILYTYTRKHTHMTLSPTYTRIIIYIYTTTQYSFCTHSKHGFMVRLATLKFDGTSLFPPAFLGGIPHFQTHANTILLVIYPIIFPVYSH